MDNFSDIYEIYSKIIKMCDNFDKVLLRDIDIVIFLNYGALTKQTINFIKHLFFEKMKCLKIVNDSNISYLTYDNKINIYNFNKQLLSYANEPSYLSTLKYLNKFLFNIYYLNCLKKYNKINLNKSENTFLDLLNNQVNLETPPPVVGVVEETPPPPVVGVVEETPPPPPVVGVVEDTQPPPVVGGVEETQPVEKEIKMVIKPIKEIIYDFLNNDFQSENGFENFCKYFLKKEVVKMLKHKELPIGVLNFEKGEYFVNSLTNPKIKYTVVYHVDGNDSCDCHSFYYSRNKNCKHINLLISITNRISKIIDLYPLVIPQINVHPFINRLYDEILNY
jgi:hypothetical protein